MITKDILIKAAEDVQQGMWCQGALFKMAWPADDIFVSSHVKELAQKAPRCAEGSINLATALSGGDWADAEKAIHAVNAVLGEFCDEKIHFGEDLLPCNTLYHHNDHHMDDMDSFEAGQHLAEIFRVAASRL